ncbi:MAG TPA: hypothetical protein VGW31_04470 [Hanamia sp.]|nr:hypothetical protein [Hanamia sp.]
MKKIIFLYQIILVLFFLFLSGCNDETKVDMGQGYYIPFQESTFDMTRFGGNGIFTYKNRHAVPIIFPNISNYKYDSLYIIVKQDFNFIETKVLLESLIFHPNLFEYDKNFVLIDEKYVMNVPHLNNSGLEDKYVDSIMHEDSHIKKMMEYKENYYIIDKTKHEVMGPFTKVEFDEKREAMHVSDKLKLE